MNANKVISTLMALLSLALIPVLWMFGAQSLPSLGSPETSGQGNNFGPLLFTWGLILMASVAAVLVAWLCYASVEDRAEDTARRPEKPQPADAPTRS
jgi:hypothetical protein